MTWPEMPEFDASAPGARPLEDVLRDLHAALAANGNTRAAEQTFSMLVATAAASELMKSMDRNDDAAARFHTDLLNACLESREVPDFHIET